MKWIRTYNKCWVCQELVQHVGNSLFASRIVHMECIRINKIKKKHPNKNYNPHGRLGF